MKKHFVAELHQGLNIEFSSIDIVGLHLAPQLAAMDFEQMGRTLLIAVGMLQGLDNGFSFHGLQGGDGRIFPQGFGMKAGVIQGR